MGGDDENSWISTDCGQALCAAYGFIKMSLDVKIKLEMYFKDAELCVTEEVFDIEREEANFVHIKSEQQVISEECRTYTLMEIEQPDALDTQSVENALLQHSCHTVPE